MCFIRTLLRIISGNYKMIDEKVYKTDYESEFTAFFKQISEKAEPESKNVNSERTIYAELNHLRDHADNPDSRNKLWEDF